MIERSGGLLQVLPEGNSMILDTLASQAGVTSDDDLRFALAAAPTQPGTISVDTADQPGGRPVPQLAYRCDFRAEEEIGASQLVRALTGDDPRNVTVLREAREHIAVFADANAIAVSSKPVGETRPTWAQTINDVLQIDRQRQRDLTGDSEAGSWPAWFTGETLIVRADDGPVATMIAHLRAAAEAGTLAVGTAGRGIGAALTLWDARDETPETVAQRAERCDWVDARMAELAPVRADLERAGYQFFFLGKPAEAPMGPDKVSAVRYWLNGMSFMSDGRQLPWQPCGWFTLDELANEQFVERDRPTRT